MTVPCASRSGRPFFEQLRAPLHVTRGVPTELDFFVEPPRGDCRHACTIDDIVHVLRALPAAHVKAIVAIVLRQPTRKQAILQPVWGRMVYSSALGPGPAIFLEAQVSDLAWSFPRSLRPEHEQELERLRRDGHVVTRGARSYRIESSFSAIRATQLYRTLLHEIGHHVDRLERAESDEAFFARPVHEREAAAHRYADEWGQRLRDRGVVPFARRTTSNDGVPSSWFADQ